MRVLIMHNAIPEYRIPWFKIINQSCEAKFVFTNYKLTQKLYHFDIDYQAIDDLNYLIREIKSFGIYFKKNKVTGTLKNGFVKLDIAVFDDLQRCLQSGNSMILKYMKIQNLKMSSGERAFLNMMSRIYFSAHIREFLPDKSFQWEESILLIIDEIDLYLHPEWQRIIVSELLNIVKDQFPNNYFQIIVTSHSPIVLSDIPIENSIYLDRNADGLTRQVQRNEQTFGANIHALYQNAFFLNDGLAMGKFAQERINIWIEEAEKANPQKMKQIINMIGEPLQCVRIAIEILSLRSRDIQETVGFVRSTIISSPNLSIRIWQHQCIILFRLVQSVIKQRVIGIAIKITKFNICTRMRRGSY